MTLTGGPQVYSHRNRETQVPRILGAYWFEDGDGLRVVTPDRIQQDEPGQYSAWIGRNPIDDGDGYWWGPIPEPMSAGATQTIDKQVDDKLSPLARRLIAWAHS